MITKNQSSVEFERLYDVLNKAQKQAVDAVEGPVMVIAGPGTGKTTILTLRIANILKQTDAAPENILALTFTESGAFAMRRKLLEIIGPAAYKVNIHTFHGFAESVIQQYPDYFPRIIGSTIITDAEQIKIIEKIINSREIKILRPYGDPSYYVKSVLNEIHILKRENISPEKLRKSIGTEEVSDSKTEREKQFKRDEKNRELASVYKKYEDALAEQKYYDFDDMLLELIHAIEENETFKLMLQESFHYILADEHQDANASQNRILELLADFHESPNLFIVGDDKQAIYRFQGASLENFLYFTKKYKDAVVIDLEHNYRSHQGILDASHSLIINNPAIPGRERRKLVSLQVGNKRIFVDEFRTTDEELEYVSMIIERLIKKGEKAEEIAILYRENKEAEDVSRALRAYGVIHRIESDKDILGDPDVVKIVMLCKAIHDPSNSELLGQALLLPELNCDVGEVTEAFSKAVKQRLSLYKVIQSGEAKSLRQAYSRIRKWSGEAQGLAFPDFLQRLIQETNMLATIVAAPNSLERLSAVEAFYDRVIRAAEAKKSFYLKDFIDYVAIVSGHGILTKRNYTDHIGGVRLMTAHRAKGLEFNHVFIVHAVDGLWGNRIKRNHFSIPVIEHARDTGRIEDERRLFYVAMTRARESVNIFYSRSHGSKETVPAQFISEIDPALISFEKPEAVASTALFVKKLQPVVPEPKPEQQSILNPQFITAKFFSQPFSVTHLNNYLKCPWEYFFVNLIRIPQAPTKHQMYGTAVHAALRSFFDSYGQDRDLTKKQLVELFKYHLGRQALTVDDREDSYEKGKNALEGYHEEYAGSWGRRLVTEYSLKSGLEIPGSLTLHLTGVLDKVEYIRDNEAVVTDFKTAKPKSRNEIEGKTKDADGNYKRQLVFYRMLTGNDAKLRMKVGEIDFIEPNERGIYKKEQFEIEKPEVEALKKQIIEVANEIVNLKFLDAGCNEKDCEYCRLGKIVRAR